MNFLLFIPACACLWLFFGGALAHRRGKAADVFKELNELCYKYDMKHFNEIDIGLKKSAYEWAMRSLPRLHQMMYSWRPLKLKWWLRKDMMDELLK